MLTDEIDRQLIERLRRNSRESIADMARALSLSRSTVKDRISRMESRGVIKGYSLMLSDELTRGRVSAHVMINIESGHATGSIVRNLRNVDHIRTAFAVSGIYDLIVLVEADSTGELDNMLDKIRDLPGIKSTLTSVILSTKFEQ